MIAPKLKEGDEIRVVAPSRSLALISAETRQNANERFAKLGLKLSFGEHAEERDRFVSSSIASRVADLHAAFADKNIKAVFTAIGGFNANQILRSLDWDLIKNNPKIFCGFSDITILSNAIFAKTGLVTYYGPHYSTLGQELYLEYTLDYFEKCLKQTEPFSVLKSESWSDDAWYKDQKNRNQIPNEGWWLINEGQAEGAVVGGNLCTFNLLQGTEYFPSLNDSLLIIEDDEMAGSATDITFDRDLQSLIHLPDFGGVKGILIGRFQKASEMTKEKLLAIIKSKKELANLPILANVDFGHTDPKITLPIGGRLKMVASQENSKIEVLEH
ncbi:MAG: S66 peptidase family protein [Candidatus Paceibacterota bacterium]